MSRYGFIGPVAQLVRAGGEAETEKDPVNLFPAERPDRGCLAWTASEAGIAKRSGIKKVHAK